MRSLPFVLLLFAFVANADRVVEPEGFWTGPIDSPVPGTLAGGKVIHAQEAAEMMKAKDALVIDVSSAPKKPEGMAADALWLPLPHDAIPGSSWIPGAGTGEISQDIDAFFRAYLEQATGGDFEHPIVIYCHEHCWLSWNAAKRAILYGYRRVHWLPEGVEGWRAAGFATAVIKPQAPPQLK